jgi:hypothetical protein
MVGSVAASSRADVEAAIVRAFRAGDGWRPRREDGVVLLRGSFLKAMLTDVASAKYANDPAPFIIDGAGRVTIVDALDLRETATVADILLEGLGVAGPINLQNARAKSLTLRNVTLLDRSADRHAPSDDDRTRIIPNTETEEFKRIAVNKKTLECGRLIVEGRLILEGLEGFEGLTLDDCKIGGAFELRGSKFSENVHVRNGEFGGDVVFGGVKDGHRVKVGGSVDFSGSRCAGRVCLHGLSVAGRNKNGGIALDLRGITVGNEIRFAEENQYFETTDGSVLIHNAKIGGDLRCEEAFFGGFNDKYFNSLAIYNCEIGGKIVLSRFRREDRARTLKFDVKGRNRPVQSGVGGDSWAFDRGVGNHGAVSPRIVVFQTRAAIVEFGYPERSPTDQQSWSIFDIADGQLTLKGFTFGLDEETTSDADSWIKLLNKNSPFSGKHSDVCCKSSSLRVENCNCGEEEPFDTGPWTAAASLLERKGQEDAARKVRYERESFFHAWEGKSFLSAPSLTAFPTLVWKQFIRIFIGYGFRPWRAIEHAVAGIAVAFILGVVLNQLGDIKVLGGAEFMSGGNVQFDPLIYALDVFLPVLESTKSQHWRPLSLWGEFSERVIAFWGWLTFVFGAISFTPLVKRT